MQKTLISQGNAQQVWSVLGMVKPHPACLDAAAGAEGRRDQQPRFRCPAAPCCLCGLAQGAFLPKGVQLENRRFCLGYGRKHIL